MASVKPIVPADIGESKLKILPDAVIETFNQLIAKNWDGHESELKQREVINALEKVGYSEQAIFEERLLDVEDVYRAVGWEVTYNKPGYNETGLATFTFRKRGV